MWRPDGWGAQTRVGVVTPHADVGPECELGAMAGDRVSVHAARAAFGAMAAGGGMDPTIPLAPVRAFAEPPHVDDAAELLAAAPVAAIGFGFTSSAYVIGAQGEAAMLSRLAQRTRGLPVVATCTAAVQALRELGAARLALVSPPWFDAELDALGAAFFAGEGFEVVSHGPADLPSDQSAIGPEAVHGAVLAATPDGAEAVFLGGNGFRAVGAIEALERDLGRPVLTANQVLLWALLRAAGSDVRPTGYGTLLERAG